MAEFFRYIIQNIEPLRIADDAMSQSGQSSALRYISGSAIRGYVVSSLSRKADFENIKRSLFSDSIAFMNAYLTTKEHTLIPSPMGFYEDKKTSEEGGEIQNVVIKGDFSDGFKRARIGNYCYFNREKINYYQMAMTSDLKVLVNPAKGQKRTVFRNEAIAAGQYFEGYIRLSGNKELDARIESLFEPKKIIMLGNARTVGMGKCYVIKSEPWEKIPYQEDAFSADGECYLMLLSDTVMRNCDGELCGLDLVSLQNQMDVEELQISFASTSVRSVHGYNRTWGGRLPSIPAYKAGSVFHLIYKGILSDEKMMNICKKGIGIRRNEGFGRVIFLKDYESINKKTPMKYVWSKDTEPRNSDIGQLREQDISILKIAAIKYYRDRLEKAMELYVISHPLEMKGIKNSKAGNIESRLLKYRYAPSDAVRVLKEYFGHVGEQEERFRVQQEKHSILFLKEQILNILNNPIEQTLFNNSEESSQVSSEDRVRTHIMGLEISEFFSPMDEEQMKVELLIKMIRYSRKQER